MTTPSGTSDSDSESLDDFSAPFHKTEASGKKTNQKCNTISEGKQVGKGRSKGEGGTSTLQFNKVHREEQSPEAMSIAAKGTVKVICNLNKLCGDFLSLSQNIDLPTSSQDGFLENVSKEFQTLRSIRASVEHGDDKIHGAFSPFQGLFESAVCSFGKAEGVQVLVASLVPFFVSSHALSSGLPSPEHLRHLCECLRFFVSCDTFTEMFRVQNKARSLFSHTVHCVLSDADITAGLMRVTVYTASCCNSVHEELEKAAVLAIGCLNALESQKQVPQLLANSTLRTATIEAARVVHLLSSYPLMESVLSILNRYRTVVLHSVNHSDPEEEHFVEARAFMRDIDDAFVPAIRDRLHVLDSVLPSSVRKSLRLFRGNAIEQKNKEDDANQQHNIRKVSCFADWARECFVQSQLLSHSSKGFVSTFRCNGVCELQVVCLFVPGCWDCCQLGSLLIV